MKKLIAIVAVLALAGCATNPNKIEITSNVKPISVPIIYSPEPPVVARPTLPHLTMTPDQILSDGEVAKAYAASVAALIGYAEQLEDIVSQYKDIHDSYNDLASKVAADWKAKTGTDLQLPATDTIITVKPPEQVKDVFKKPLTTLPNTPPCCKQAPTKQPATEEPPVDPAKPLVVPPTSLH